ncbi:MAG TPA: hypothetical protein VGN57_07790 [Pirellulaceae bacterium]|nr:hypothetical protein [Pirellulaceae bacterium]
MGWLFVGMLLLISAAGWWKFHRDLYVEEIQVIRALRNSGGRISVGRSRALDVRLTQEEDLSGEIPWNAPLLPAVERLYIEGELPDDVRDAAARLPRLKYLLLEPARTNGIAPAPVIHPPFDYEAHLGRALPEPPASTLSAESVSTPLPEGEPVDADEAARIADAIYDAWSDEAAVPSRLLVVSRSASLSGPTKSQTVAQVIGPDRRFLVREQNGVQQASDLSNGLRTNFLRGSGGAWRRQSRGADRQENGHGFRSFPDEPFPYLAPDFGGFSTVTRAIEAMPRLEFDRIAKIDDARYRVDFAPFAAPMNEHEALINVFDPRVTQWNLVLRSDLDWAPEEVKMVQQIQQTGWKSPRTYERQISQRFRREGDYVLLTERMVRSNYGLPPDSPVGSPLSNHLYAYQIDPQYDERIFDPRSLDSDPWAARRELPWLPWYVVTFLLGCGCAVALLVRRVAPVAPNRLRQIAKSRPKPTQFRRVGH